MSQRNSPVIEIIFYSFCRCREHWCQAPLLLVLLIKVQMRPPIWNPWNHKCLGFVKYLHGHNENDLDVGPKSKHETHLFDMYSEIPFAVSLVGLHLRVTCRIFHVWQLHAGTQRTWNIWTFRLQGSSVCCLSRRVQGGPQTVAVVMSAVLFGHLLKHWLRTGGPCCS